MQIPDQVRDDMVWNDKESNKIFSSCKREIHRMKAHNYYVYNLSNKNNKVIYTGMTNDIYRRMYEHKNHILEGVTKKYKVDKLVYYEYMSSVEEAIRREKEIKKWRREKKNNLIGTLNPEWRDLAEEFKRNNEEIPQSRTPSE